MVELTNLEILVKYKTWADEIFYHAISRLPDEELKRTRPMLFGNIFSLFNHIYAMDGVWKSHLEGIPHNLQTRNPENLSSFTDLRENQATINNWYENYIDNLCIEKYKEMVNFTFIGGVEGKMKRFEIIQHVVNHASYHRGHIEGVLYQMSVEPPTTDMPVFLREIHA
jgi:uncharacterized damage-inducible protein DinB